MIVGIRRYRLNPVYTFSAIAATTNPRKLSGIGAADSGGCREKPGALEILLVPASHFGTVIKSIC
jgi:hypothetical protein